MWNLAASTVNAAFNLVGAGYSAVEYGYNESAQALIGQEGWLTGEGLETDLMLLGLYGVMNPNDIAMAAQSIRNLPVGLLHLETTLPVWLERRGGPRGILEWMSGQTSELARVLLCTVARRGKARSTQPHRPSTNTARRRICIALFRLRRMRLLDTDQESPRIESRGTSMRLHRLRLRIRNGVPVVLSSCSYRTSTMC
ncbi:MAG: hypothetical protein ACOC2Y_02940 [Spirochaetota bacterium]